MKPFARYLCLGLLGLLTSWISVAQVPFSKGVNLTAWFQAGSPGQIQFSRYSKKDFENIKSLGCDVVRLPINLHSMTSGEPDYIPDALFLHFLDQVVDWSEELQMHLILDNHTFDPATNTNPSIEAPLIKVWTQMAQHFKDRSEYIHYEILNEPHGIEDATWNVIQQNVIDAIRAVDTKHFIIVGPANWNSYHNLKNLPVYEDEKLLYTFHFYDPFIFTHQGASWTDPSMVPLGGVPFPYQVSRMPSTPAALKGTWIDGAIQNYHNDGRAAMVTQLIDIAVQFKNTRGVPVFCGEFGVYIPNSPENDRVNWYGLVRGYLEEKGIPWTIWDYQGGFGLFEKNSKEYFEHDLNVPLLESLKFIVPQQTEYVKRPLRNGLTIYHDDFGQDMSNRSASGTGQLDFYSPENPQHGDYCIFWTGVGQYDAIAFDFNRDLDFSMLVAHDYFLEFYVRGTSSTTLFDVRFIDSDGTGADLPWRKGKTITSIPADNGWHLVQIPLGDLEEKGAWDGTWHPPAGENFDWRAVDRFEIIPEHQSLEGVAFWLDEIRITGEEITVSIADREISSKGLEIYPNPATGRTRIDYVVAGDGPVAIGLYDLNGQLVKTLVDQSMKRGMYSVSLNASEIPSGVVVLQMKSSGTLATRRLVILR